MQVREIMSTDILHVALDDKLRDAARRMSGRNVSSAIVEPTTPGSRPGIVTERDVVDAVAVGQNPDSERVQDHFTPDAVSVPHDSSLQRAAEEMTAGGFRHLVVLLHGSEGPTRTGTAPSVWRGRSED